MNWDWIANRYPDVLDQLGQHAWLTLVPTVLGLVIALPLGAVAHRVRWLRAPLVQLSALIYTIPSLALFVLLPGVLGTKILDPVNVVVALTLYTVALLVRTVADALDTVPEEVRMAATALGYGSVRRMVTVELPVAIPVIGAGLRVATVSSVALVSIAALIGVPQLGSLFTEGFQTDNTTAIIVGILGCLLLALVFDLLLVLLLTVITPWRRATARLSDGDRPTALPGDAPGSRSAEAVTA